jgi:RNA polymerase sigma factor (TIGR02999 family)
MSAQPPDAVPPADLTTLLNAWREGDGTAFGHLIDKVYDELKRVAASRLRQVGGSPTLSPTELLHEAVLRVMPGEMDFKNRAHFFAAMSLTIRSILVDHARARAADKRGGDRIRVTYTEGAAGEESAIADLLSIEQSLAELERLDPRCGQVVQLSYFGGLTHEEVAAVLNISISSVTRDLRFARGWIAKELGHDT